MTYYKRIDGLRFVAILLVLIEHFAHYIGKWFSAGYYGVDLFFVISGFLITGILINSKEKNFGAAYKKFLGRRTLRIFPIYYLTIFVLFLFQLEIVQSYWAYLVTYTFNYAMVYYNLPHNPLTHFWSLCVEEQFYLFWPFIVLGLRNNISSIYILIISLILIAFSQMLFNVIPSLAPYNSFNLLTRMGSLGVGALGAVLVKTNKIPVKFLESKYFEYFVLTLLCIMLVINTKLKFPVLAFCSLFLVIKAVHSGFQLKFINYILENRHLIYIGTISYGIYVYHVPLAYYFEKYVFNQVWQCIDFESLGYFGYLRYHSWLIKLPLYSGLSIAMAALSFRYIERPVLLLKNRYFK